MKYLLKVIGNEKFYIATLKQKVTVKYTVLMRLNTHSKKKEMLV